MTMIDAWELAITPLVWGPEYNSELRLVLGPSSAAHKLSDGLDPILGRIKQQRSSLPFTTAVTWVAGRALVVLDIQSLARDTQSNRLGHDITIGMWIEPSVANLVRDPVSTAFQVFTSFLANEHGESELTQDVVTRMAEKCLAKGSLLLDEERLSGILQELEVRFGLGSDAKKTSRGTVLTRSMIGRRAGHLMRWRSYREAQAYFKNLDQQVLPEADGLGISRPLALASYREDQTFALLAIYASVLMLVRTHDVYTSPGAQLVVRVTLLILCSIGVVLSLRSGVRTEKRTQARVTTFNEARLRLLTKERSLNYLTLLVRFGLATGFVLATFVAFGH